MTVTRSDSLQVEYNEPALTSQPPRRAASPSDLHACIFLLGFNGVGHSVDAH